AADPESLAGDRVGGLEVDVEVLVADRHAALVEVDLERALAVMQGRGDRLADVDVAGVERDELAGGDRRVGSVGRVRDRAAAAATPAELLLDAVLLAGSGVVCGFVVVVMRVRSFARFVLQHRGLLAPPYEGLWWLLPSRIQSGNSQFNCQRLVAT